MKKLLISAIAIAAAISQASFAQTLTPDQLAQRGLPGGVRAVKNAAQSAATAGCWRHRRQPA
jgi:hypothetical protein